MKRKKKPIYSWWGALREYDYSHIDEKRIQYTIKVKNIILVIRVLKKGFLSLRFPTYAYAIVSDKKGDKKMELSLMYCEHCDSVYPEDVEHRCKLTKRIVRMVNGFIKKT